MNALICVLFHSGVIQVFLPSFVCSEQQKPADILTDIAHNREKIEKIFRKVSTLNILLKNYEQPDGILQSFGNIFKFAEQSFVVFNFDSEEDHSEWIEHCREFKDNRDVKSAYYERFYQKSHESPKIKSVLNSFEDSERQEKTFSDDFVDPQGFVPSKEVVGSKALPESFADSLDNWYTFRKAGFILFCPLEVLEIYLGCLLCRSGTYLIVIDSGKDETTLREVCEVLNAAWKSSTNLKLFVLIFNEIYVLNPFEIDRTTKAFGILEKLSDGAIKRNFRNLNRYPMTVDMFYSAYSIIRNQTFTGKLNTFRGPDVKVAEFIEERMNASMTVIKNEGKFGEKLSNGTLTGSLGYLVRRKADIAMTAFFMKDYETRACEFAYPLYMDELCVVVKKAARIPSVLLPLVIFDEYLWLNLFCSGILIGIVWSMLRFMNNVIKRPSDRVERVAFYMRSYNLSPFVAQQSQLRQFAQLFIDTWMLFLSVPMRRFSRVQNERIFIASICFVSINFIALYQSGLSTVFVKPLYFKDITSLEQLDKSGDIIKVKYSGYLTDVFPEDSTGTIKNLHNKMKLVVTNVSAMDLVSKDNKVATITRKTTTKLDNALYFINKKLYLVEKECPKNYFLAYMVPVNSGFLERINEILLDIQRYGFILKWIDEINFRMTLVNLKSIRFESNHAKTLSLEDLKLPFLVLASGNGLGVVIIVLELLINIRRKAKKMM